LGKPPNRPPEADAETNERQTTTVVRIEDAFERVLEGKVLKRELPEVARRLTQIAVSEQFSEPMPHPKHLREYDDILPGSAERILSMAERNLEHNNITLTWIKRLSALTSQTANSACISGRVYSDF
jgi:hypothetical protein